MILSRRPKDDESKDGFTNWPFMTTHTWGENPRGKWRLIVRFESDEPQQGWLNRWSLVFHGTKSPPYKGITPLQGHINSKLQVSSCSSLAPLTMNCDQQLCLNRGEMVLCSFQVVQKAHKRMA